MTIKELVLKDMDFFGRQSKNWFQRTWIFSKHLFEKDQKIVLKDVDFFRTFFEGNF